MVGGHPAVDSLDRDHEARRERAGQERGVDADHVGGVQGVQAEACARTDREMASAHRAILACPADDGRH